MYGCLAQIRIGRHVRGVDAVTEGRCVNLSGRTSLAQAVDLMSTADAVVSNDSG